MDLNDSDWQKDETDFQKNKANDEARNFLSNGQMVTKKHRLKDVAPQIIASCIIHCIVIQAGVNMAYSSILTKGLEVNGTGIYANENERSWIASVVTLTLPIGSLITGPLMDTFGRKMICIICCIPAIISWILLIIADSLTLIYIARVVAGAAAGLTTVGLIYVSEITHPQFRPMLLCLNSVFVSLGILITCSLAVFLNWRNIAIAFLGLEVCVLIILFLLPESPYWLACFGKGMLSEARTKGVQRSLRWLNKKEEVYEQEYARITEAYERNGSKEEQSKTWLQDMKSFCLILRLPSVYKPLIILFIMFLFQQFSGTYVVIFYAISVFDDLGGSFGEGLDENGALVMLGVIRFAMSIIAVFFSRKYGRRVLCISSGLGMMFSMFFSGMYMYLTSSCDENGEMKENMADQKWLLLVIILFYVCMSSFGFAIIPWTLIGELLPVSVRGIGGGVMVSYAYVIMFGVNKAYPFAVNAMSMQGVCFFFSFVALLGTIFIYLFLPETFGKSFGDIENFFKKSTIVPKIQMATSLS